MRGRSHNGPSSVVFVLIHSCDDVRLTWKVNRTIWCCSYEGLNNVVILDYRGIGVLKMFLGLHISKVVVWFNFSEFASTASILFSGIPLDGWNWWNWIQLWLLSCSLKKHEKTLITEKTSCSRFLRLNRVFMLEEKHYVSYFDLVRLSIMIVVAFVFPEGFREILAG